MRGYATEGVTVKRDIVFSCIVLAILVAGATVFAATQSRVTGIVRDTAGNPVPDAVVRITCPEQPAYEKVLSVDEDGAFRLLLLDATYTYIFHIDADGYVGHDEEFKVPIATMDNLFEFALKSEAEADARAKEALLSKPGYSELQAARTALAGGDTAGAMAALETAVTAAPDLVAAWEELTELTYKEGDAATAAKRAEHCLEQDDESVRCLAVAANAAQDLGDAEAYERYLARYQEANPDDPATIFNQAVAFINAQDDAQARPLLEQCLEVDDEFSKCLFEYGMVLLRSGDTAGAKEHLERYLELHPDGEDAAMAAEVAKYL
jgi:Tfp pilus assembly protein PilF